jgi:Predicted metal-binding, possibly nucleic acid-binding protein
MSRGLSLVGDVTGEELELAETDAILRGPVSVSLDLMKADDMIAVTGVLEGTVVRQCVRCLKEYDDAVAFSVHAAFAREGKESKVGARQSKPGEPRKGRPGATKTEADVEAEDEGDDRYFYQGDHIELAPMLREHIILASPMQPRCRENCVGLCARCGKDLNEGPCQCPAEAPSTAIRVIRTSKT